MSYDTQLILFLTACAASYTTLHLLERHITPRDTRKSKARP